MIKSLTFSSHHQTKRRLATVPLILRGKEIITQNTEPVYSHKNTSKIIHDFAVLQNLESEISQVCKDSYDGFIEWSSMSHQDRSKILTKAATIMRSKEPEFVAAHEEIGAASWFGSFNVSTASSHIEEYAKLLSQPEGVIPKSDSCDLALTVRTPIGPVYSIAPWNAPIILGSRSITAPLAAGCSVVLKSSERSPLVSYFLAKCFIEAGVPPKAIQLIHLAPKDNVKATDLILSNKNIRKVNFTGSTLVGNKIAMVASMYLKPYLLELGGKNYSIVCKDADIPRAIDSTLFSSFTHKGQICMCLDKIFIHESIYNVFIEKLQQAAKKYSKNPDHQIPQRDMTSTTKIHDLINDALNKGAKIVFGDRPELIMSSTGEHATLSPIILSDVNSKMAIDSVETFGPVLAVYKYKDENKLVDIMNSTDYGLKASVWSSNVLNALSIAKRIESGGVHINNSSIHDEATTPHGGVKSSGCGRFNGIWGIDEFSYVKTITLNQ